MKLPLILAAFFFVTTHARADDSAKLIHDWQATGGHLKNAIYHIDHTVLLCLPKNKAISLDNIQFDGSKMPISLAVIDAQAFSAKIGLLVDNGMYITDPGINHSFTVNVTFILPAWVFPLGKKPFAPPLIVLVAPDECEKSIA